MSDEDILLKDSGILSCFIVHASFSSCVSAPCRIRNYLPVQKGPFLPISNPKPRTMSESDPNSNPTKYCQSDPMPTSPNSNPIIRHFFKSKIDFRNKSVGCANGAHRNEFFGANATCQLSQLPFLRRLRADITDDFNLNKYELGMSVRRSTFGSDGSKTRVQIRI